MNAREYQIQALRTDHPNYAEIRNRINNVNSAILLHAQLGITTETGELADAIKRCLIYGQVLDVSNIIEECGDLLWYLNLLLGNFGFDIEDAMKHNIEKLAIRYPEKFTEELAKERKDKQTP